MIWVAAHWEKQEKRLKSRRDDPVLTHTKRGEGTAPSQNLFLLLCRGLRLVGLGLLLNRQQLHLKNQRGVRTNIPARASLRVSQRRGHEQLPLRSHRHQLQRFRPALDHSIYRKRCRLATLIGAVEFRAVDQSPTVVADHRIARGRLRSVAFFQDLVLETARQRDDTLFRLVGGQKRFAFFLVRLARHLHLLLLFLAQLVLHFHQCRLRFFLRKQSFATRQGSSQALCHDAWVHVDRLLVQARPQIHPQRVAEFVFRRLQSRGCRALRRT